jgi:hypothetical protein
LTIVDARLETILQLREEIDGIDRAARQPVVSGQATSLSYSLGSFSSSFFPEQRKLAEILSDVVATVKRVCARLAPTATVETAADGVTARTMIHFNGRAASVWVGAPSPQMASAHIASLEKTLHLRTAVAAVVLSAGSAIISISIAVTNPLTLPSAWSSAKALKLALDRLAAAVEAA